MFFKISRHSWMHISIFEKNTQRPIFLFCDTLILINHRKTETRIFWDKWTWKKFKKEEFDIGGCHARMREKLSYLQIPKTTSMFYK